jgi:hypothetical protein
MLHVHLIGFIERNLNESTEQWIWKGEICEYASASSQKITLDNKFQKIFCICDEYVINLFASMKLEKGHENITWL